ncbi:MAG: PLP-dependent aminotransferase family protein [Bdellovibrionales bacterium]
MKRGADDREKEVLNPDMRSNRVHLSQLSNQICPCSIERKSGTLQRKGDKLETAATMAAAAAKANVKANAKARSGTKANVKTPYLRIRLPQSRQQIRSKDLVDAIQKELRTGVVPAGTRLPPVRVIAHQLGISKNTVQSAYEELEARGMICGRSRFGYFVEKSETSGAVSPRPMTAPAPVLIEGKFPPVFRLSKDKTATRSIPLGSVFIDRELLPIAKIEQCFRSVLKTPGLHYLYDNQGFEPLRKVIAKRLNARGICAHPDHIVITTGSQQALDVVARSLKTRSIATENPAYGLGKLLFEMNQMKVTGLPLDPFRGIDLGEWEEAIAETRPAALYLTPNFHNPTGYSYSSSELEAILGLARKYAFGVIEDDWGSDMLSFSEFRTPLRSLGGDNVLYLNSFTKKLLPSLRIGYLLANEPMMPALLAAKRVGTLGNPAVIEAALFEFLDRGYFDTHLKNLHVALDERYQSCLSALENSMPDGVRWTKPGGGPVLWLELPRTIDLKRLDEALLSRGVTLDMRTADWFFGAPHLHGIKIGYAQTDSKQMEKGIGILAAELKRALK